VLQALGTAHGLGQGQAGVIQALGQFAGRGAGPWIALRAEAQPRQALAHDWPTGEGDLVRPFFHERGSNLGQTHIEGLGEHVGHALRKQRARGLVVHKLLHDALGQGAEDRAHLKGLGQAIVPAVHKEVVVVVPVKVLQGLELLIIAVGQVEQR